jgi:CDP-glucose 4,6-dehydratase
MLENKDLSSINPTFWLNRRVLVTGHTGFLGSWLAVWLSELGADLMGFARRPPAPESLLALAGLEHRVASLAGDIRDRARVVQTVASLAPEVIVHLAGRYTAAEGLKRPLDSFDTNATGTLNLLHAACRTPELRAIVVVTAADAVPPDTDGSPAAVGSGDPVSASLACAEIIAETFRRCYLQPADGIGLATLRLPEIVGGGDFGRGRLVPDVVRAAAAGRLAAPATPGLARPLLHVLDALRHCLELAEALVHRPRACASAWSPDAAPPGAWPADAIADHVMAHIEGRQPPANPVPRPARPVLHLDCLGLRSESTPSLVRDRAPLEGCATLDVATALGWTVEGYRRLEADGDAGFIAEQIERFGALSKAPTSRGALPFDPPKPPAKASHVSLSA